MGSAFPDGGRVSPDGADGGSDRGRPRVAGLVLAAGRSRRMGDENKLLQHVDGVPMVSAVVERFLEAGLEPVLVVTGHQAEAVESALEGLEKAEGRRVRIVHNPRFAEGMGTSVAAGVAALRKGVDGVLVGLADMPRVTVATLQALLGAFVAASSGAGQPGAGTGASGTADPGAATSGSDAPGTGDPDAATPESAVPGPAAVCIPVHRGKRGNPVLWGARFFPELEALTGDVGGRTLLNEHAGAVREVAVEDPGVLLDVDTLEALERVREVEPRSGA